MERQRAARRAVQACREPARTHRNGTRREAAGGGMPGFGPGDLSGLARRTNKLSSTPFYPQPAGMHRYHCGVGTFSPTFEGVSEFGLARLATFWGLSPAPLDILRGFATLSLALASGCRRNQEGQQGESDPIPRTARPFSAWGKAKGRADLAQWQSSCFVNSSSQVAAMRPRTMQDSASCRGFLLPDQGGRPRTTVPSR